MIFVLFFGAKSISRFPGHTKSIVYVEERCLDKRGNFWTLFFSAYRNWYGRLHEFHMEWNGMKTAVSKRILKTSLTTISRTISLSFQSSFHLSLTVLVCYRFPIAI